MSIAQFKSNICIFYGQNMTIAPSSDAAPPGGPELIPWVGEDTWNTAWVGQVEDDNPPPSVDIASPVETDEWVSHSGL